MVDVDQPVDSESALIAKSPGRFAWDIRPTLAWDYSSPKSSKFLFRPKAGHLIFDNLVCLNYAGCIRSGPVESVTHPLAERGDVSSDTGPDRALLMLFEIRNGLHIRAGRRSFDIPSAMGERS